MLLTLFTTVTLALTVSASKLFVSSYTGNITTLELTKSKSNLAQIQVSNGCAPNASWLHLDAKHDILYCIDENIVGSNGSLHSFKVDKSSGALTKIQNITIAQAPVHATIYTNSEGAQLLAVAHYAWALTTYELSQDGDFKPLQQFNFTMKKPGADPARQAAPHPHQVLVDPRNNYFVVPDLGADILRIFQINRNTLRIVELEPFKLPPGSGPRHGTFRRTYSDHLRYKSVTRDVTRQYHGQQDLFYLVTELSNDLLGYKVDYLPNAGGLDFIPVGNSSKTYGTNKAAVFAGNRASEIDACLHRDSLLVSNRNATFFDIANPDPKNSTHVASDTLATFSLDSEGNFKFEALSPAGGSFPRSFSINEKGNLVAVGLQKSGRVAIYKRNKKTGKVKDTVLASFEGLGEVTSIVWMD